MDAELSIRLTPIANVGRIDNPTHLKDYTAFNDIPSRSPPAASHKKSHRLPARYLHAAWKCLPDIHAQDLCAGIHQQAFHTHDIIALECFQRSLKVAGRRDHMIVRNMRIDIFIGIQRSDLPTEMQGAVTLPYG
jgi:hypothetical protein